MAGSAELFETFSSAGEPTGLVARGVVHRLGLWHRACNVLLFHPDGRLYLQRRAATKDIWPNAWDISVGEHLQPGETYEQAAYRGLAEELAVVDTTLSPLGTVTRGCVDMPELEIHDHELQQSFRGEYAGEIRPDPNEVAEVRLLALTVIAREVAARPDDFTPWLRSRLTEFGYI
jgi:isopentenyl-diphosphate Delta-isomerase